MPALARAEMDVVRTIQGQMKGHDGGEALRRVIDGSKAVEHQLAVCCCRAGMGKHCTMQGSVGRPGFTRTHGRKAEAGHTTTAHQQSNPYQLLKSKSSTGDGLYGCAAISFYNLT